MGEVVIKNAGDGRLAVVGPAGRLFTSAISESIQDHAADTGIESKYNINTLDITLTSDSKTSVLYIKNESTEGDLIIQSLIYNLGNTTGGSGDVKIDVLRNPTAGDIVTNGNNVGVGTGVEANQNFGSSKILVGKFYKGASGETAFSDGSVTISTRSASNTGRILIALGNVSVPRGSSLGIDYTPPSGNTSQIVQFAVACFLKIGELDH
jgi:hypothetical protein